VSSVLVPAVMALVEQERMVAGRSAPEPRSVSPMDPVRVEMVLELV
jgi:hypothetical protein